MTRRWAWGPWRQWAGRLVGGLLLAGLVVAVSLAIHPRLALPPSEDPALESAHEKLDTMVEAYRAEPLDLMATEGTRTLARAVILSEDSAYGSRPDWLPPISPLGVGRAVRDNLFRGVRSGGSTIPQQLAKLMLRRSQGGWYDKWRELVFATEMVRRHEPFILLGLYINLSLSLGTRDPVMGARNAALTLRRKPLVAISREDALLLACLPRGWHKVRKRPEIAVRRVLALKARLETEGQWRTSQTSYLDKPELLDLDGVFSLWFGWQAFQSGGERRPDVAAAAVFALEALQAQEAQLEEQGVESTSGLLLVQPDESGRWSPRVVTDPSLQAPLFNLASGAKVALLQLAVERVSPEVLAEIRQPVGGAIRWWWREGGGPVSGGRPGRIEPRDAMSPARRAALGEVTVVEAVAHSINSSTMRYLVDVLPYLLYLDDPIRYRREARALVPEASALATAGERQVASHRLRQLGAFIGPEDIADELSAQAAALYLIRLLAQHRRAGGLTRRRALPEDPTSLLGNSSAESAADIALYMGRVFFEKGQGCTLSPTGRALSHHFREGTARQLAAALPKRFGLTAWKSGTSPHDDGMTLSVALCIDEHPAVALATLRTIVPDKLPEKTYSGRVLSGPLSAFILDLQTRGHSVRGPEPPPISDLLDPSTAHRNDPPE